MWDMIGLSNVVNCPSTVYWAEYFSTDMQGRSLSLSEFLTLWIVSGSLYHKLGDLEVVQRRRLGCRIFTRDGTVEGGLGSKIGKMRSQPAVQGQKRLPPLQGSLDVPRPENCPMKSSGFHTPTSVRTWMWAHLERVCPGESGPLLSQTLKEWHQKLPAHNIRSSSDKSFLEEGRPPGAYWSPRHYSISFTY